MAEDPAGRYALGCDVDMTGADWPPFAFSGELDGRGHAVLNLRVIYHPLRSLCSPPVPQQ